MKHTHPIQILGAAVVAALTFLLSLGAARADTIKLKDGKTIEGVITFEADDMLKIRVQTSSSITETKTILKADVAEVIKSAPDDVDFAKLAQLLPTPSLMTTSQYQSLIDKGPQAFLNSYPESKHRPEVEKLKKELDDEMGKVNLGFIKIEGEWISPKSQRDFRELIAARILNLQIRLKGQGNDFIGSLRDFEKMEENYYGTPSYIEAVGFALQLLPSVGQRLQRMVADVEFQNKQFEENLAKMPEEKRGPVIAARKQEEDNLKKRYDADKASGVKWYQVNTRDKADLTNYIQLVSGEIQGLKGIDLVALEELAKQLVKVDELIAEDKIDDAKELLKTAAGVSSGRGKSGGSNSGSSPYGGMSRSGSSGGSRGSKTKVKTTYVAVLQGKIAQKEDAIAAKKVQDKNAAEGEEARKAILQGRNVVSAAPVISTETVEGQEASSANAGTNALTGLIDSTVIEKKPEPSNTAKKVVPKSKAKKSAPKKSDDEDDPPKPVASSGFQWSVQKIIIGVALLMALTVGLMKILGIGGAKAE